MGLDENNSLWEGNIQGNWMEFSYAKWVYFYKKASSLIRAKTSRTRDKPIKDKEIMRYEDTAREYLKNTLNFFSEGDWQLMKIDALLLLVKLCDDESRKKDREKYFYYAVDIARQHLWDAFQGSSLEKDIIETYISDINQSLKDMRRSEFVTQLDQLSRLSILSESDNRRKEQYKEAQLLVKSERMHDYPKSTLRDLEKIIGPIRLLVVSENSDKVIINNRVPEAEIETIRKTSKNKEEIMMDIFDKPRKYLVIADYTGNNHGNDFWGALEENPLKKVIDPLIRALVKKDEQTFFFSSALFLDRIEEAEATDVFSRQPRNDYRNFITDVIQKSINPLEFHEAREDKDYVDNFLKALDICREISMKQGKDEKDHTGYLQQRIDTILWGKIERKVLDMVKSMLLSRSEAMNGSGYPFGFNKDHIPLEWKLYSIIRTYEAFSLTWDQEEIVKSMKLWSDAGYFDSKAVQVFLESLDNGGFAKIQTDPDNASPVSEHRRNRYTPYIQSWNEILDITKKIGENYRIWRRDEKDNGARNISFRNVDELQSRLLSVADVMIPIILMRHSETPSDALGWALGGVPGNDSELLTAAGIRDAYMKGNLFHGQQIQIRTTPILRGHETATAICYNVRKCVDVTMASHDNSLVFPTCASCPGVIMDEALRNPPKHLPTSRNISLLARIVVDNNAKRPEEWWLMEFLMKLISSPKSQTNLIVTHGDTAVALMVWLENLFEKEQISGKKIPIKNDVILELLMRWGRLVSEEEQKTRGLVFRSKNWKTVLSHINTLSKKVFWEAFYVLQKEERIKIGTLHGQFFDFFDAKIEKSPERLSLFIEQLDRDPVTKHISLLLKTEGLIK